MPRWYFLLLPVAVIVVTFAYAAGALSGDPVSPVEQPAPIVLKAPASDAEEPTEKTSSATPRPENTPNQTMPDQTTPPTQEPSPDSPGQNSPGQNSPGQNSPGDKVRHDEDDDDDGAPVRVVTPEPTEVDPTRTDDDPDDDPDDWDDDLAVLDDEDDPDDEDDLDDD